MLFLADLEKNNRRSRTAREQLYRFFSSQKVEFLTTLHGEQLENRWLSGASSGRFLDLFSSCSPCKVFSNRYSGKRLSPQNLFCLNNRELRRSIGWWLYFSGYKLVFKNISTRFSKLNTPWFNSVSNNWKVYFTAVV